MRGNDLNGYISAGIRTEHGRVTGVDTSRGFIGAKKVGVAVAGSSSKVMAHAGMRLPMESHVLQAFVSEGLKPLIDGEAFFVELIQAIQDAREAIDIQIYIFDSDDYALRIADLLNEREA